MYVKVPLFPCSCQYILLFSKHRDSKIRISWLKTWKTSSFKNHIWLISSHSWLNINQQNKQKSFKHISVKKLDQSYFTPRSQETYCNTLCATYLKRYLEDPQSFHNKDLWQNNVYSDLPKPKNMRENLDKCSFMHKTMSYHIQHLSLIFSLAGVWFIHTNRKFLMMV